MVEPSDAGLESLTSDMVMLPSTLTLESLNSALGPFVVAGEASLVPVAEWLLLGCMVYAFQKRINFPCIIGQKKQHMLR